MGSTTLITVDEYLTTAYSPDCDYVDGHIEERNLGEQPQSGLQRAFITYLDTRRDQWGIRVWPSSASRPPRDVFALQIFVSP